MTIVVGLSCHTIRQKSTRVLGVGPIKIARVCLLKEPIDIIGQQYYCCTHSHWIYVSTITNTPSATLWVSY